MSNLLLQAIQMTAQGVQQASNPTELSYGTVEALKPLKISREQKQTLEGDEFFILTSAVKDFEIDISLSTNSEKSGFKTTHTHACDAESQVYPAEFNSDHTHKVAGKKKIKVHNALKVGDKVILLSVSGGQKYIILDRMEPLKTEGEWV